MTTRPADDPTRPSDAFLEWAWRIPFLFSAVMVVVGLWVRLRLVESDAFTQVVATKRVEKLPLAAVFRSHWRQLILGTFIMLATYVLFFGVFTLASSPWADRHGRRKTLIFVTLAIIGFGLLFVPLLGAGFVGVMFFLILGFSLMGMNFGPMGALLPELFPTSVRYTGSAFAYNMSSILGAAVAPFIAIWLWTLGEGSPFWVGVYLSVMAVITLVALLLSRETRDIDIEH